MKTTMWMALGATLLLAACGSSPETKSEPAAAVIDPNGGRWQLVSCHVDGRGCRDEDIYRSEDGCQRAGRELERAGDKERRAACRKLKD